MRRLLPFAMLSGAMLSGMVLLPAAASGAEMKIGYVDLQRALNEVEEGKAAKAALKAKFDQSQAKIKKEEDALAARKDELAKKRLAMDEATLRQKADELEQEFMRVSNVFSKLQKELSDEERQATNRIFSRMRVLIAEYAEKNGFTFVFDQSGAALVYGPPSLDLTNELIRLYNDAHKPSKK